MLSLSHIRRLPSRRWLHSLPGRSFSAPHVYECNVKIGALVRAGKVEVARRLFDEMTERDEVSWNTMIAAYWRENDCEESTRLFRLMPRRNVVSWNSMISGCVENGDIGMAFRYFLEMPVRNIASWNAMISGLVKFDRVDEAERLFEKMPGRNVISYTALIDGFARNGNIGRARCLFDSLRTKNVVTWAAMISGYVENEMYDEARSLFRSMPDKNVVAITAMITAYCKERKVDLARKLFEGMEEKDPVSWNAMISGYANNEHGAEAFRLYMQMLQSCTQPDHSTLLVILTACSVLSSLQCGKQIHATTVKMGLESDTSLCNSLITMYSKCGSISDSDSLFGRIRNPRLVSWNTMIAAFAQHGLCDKACTLFGDLVASGYSPDGVTFLSILSACGHAGMVDESVLWFNVMVLEFRIPPRAEHFSCLVDVASRAGELGRACEVIKAMPFQADGAVWSALLGACQAYPNVELAELAANKLVELNPLNSGAYIMLSNTYAAAGKWVDVTKVRSLMKEQGVRKQPGHSWVELGDKVHMFLGGDTSHPDIQRIHLQLGTLYIHMMVRNGDEAPTCTVPGKLTSAVPTCPSKR